jgi:hypothetical protein
MQETIAVTLAVSSTVAGLLDPPRERVYKKKKRKNDPSKRRDNETVLTSFPRDAEFGQKRE